MNSTESDWDSSTLMQIEFTENNLTETNSTNSTDFNSFYFYKTEQFTVLWILFIVIVLGNSAVLVTLYMNKNRKSRMNYFIKQLAIADLLVGLLNVLTDIIWRLTVSWRAGNIACKVIRFVEVTVTYSSTFVLVSLSIDRFDAICYPLNFAASWSRAKWLVGVAWMLSVIFSLPMMILYEVKSIEGQTQCWIDLGEPWKWQVYMSLVSTSLFFLPALIITACYAIIIRTIWQKGAVMAPPKPSSRKNIHHHELESRRASSRGIIPRAKVKTVKMTFVIVIVFVLCWSPYIVFGMLQVFDQIPRTQTNIAVATFIQSLAPLNSAANPLIYCLFSAQGLRTLRRLQAVRWIQSKCCCQTVENGANNNRTNGYESARTFTTSLTTTSRRSTVNLNTSVVRPNNCKVTIIEQPKTVMTLSEV